MAPHAQATRRTPRRTAAQSELERIPGAQRRAVPARLDVQLASLERRAPAGEAWLHEEKQDGYRMLARLADGDVRLVTRNHLDWTDRFPELQRALSQLALPDTVLDGEIVHLDRRGRSSFSALQQALSEGRTAALAYVVFDVLFLRGVDLRAVALEERKRILHSALARAPARVRCSGHQSGDGERFFGAACRRGLEGIISKRRDAPYTAGRSASWLKVKCVHAEEFVVVGYTEPQRSRVGFGALLVGYHTPAGELAYAGKVGTGYTSEFLQRFRAQLERIERRTPTVALPAGLYMPARVHWVEPRFVAQIGFAEWTGDSILRQARFLGLREDKAPAEVVIDRQPPRVLRAARRASGTAAGRRR